MYEQPKLLVRLMFVTGMVIDLLITTQVAPGLCKRQLRYICSAAPTGCSSSDSNAWFIHNCRKGMNQKYPVTSPWIFASEVMQSLMQ